MIDLADPHPARIYTSWGTVLYVDSASGQLRHGPIETSPENAVFVADRTAAGPYREGRFMFDNGERLEPIACGALSCRSVAMAGDLDPPVAPTLLELLPLERGLIAFRSGGRFMCAQPDGRLDLKNIRCSTWECFLGSEDWCSVSPSIDINKTLRDLKETIDWNRISKYIVDARLRMKACAASTATKVLIYGYPQWSHGRVYYDLCKHLHERGYILDIINWQENHASYIDELIAFYDLVLTALDGVRSLVDTYGVPYEQIIALSHHEMDMRMLVDQKGVEIFEKFAGYGVVGYQLFDASAILGIHRPPLVAQLGVNFAQFYCEVPERLATVGLASSYSQKTSLGVEIKRGELAEAVAAAAGLEFKVAGSTANQISFHDMPDFYRSVDAVLVPSVTEGAQLPIREAAAAGRLVISTPVGDFPLRASQGIGIVAPIEAHKYKKFVAETLQYYRDNPADFTEICRKTQDAARQLDWPNMIGDWVELIETAKEYLLQQAQSHQQGGRFADAEKLMARQSSSEYASAFGRVAEISESSGKLNDSGCVQGSRAKFGAIPIRISGFRSTQSRPISKGGIPIIHF